MEGLMKRFFGLAALFAVVAIAFIATKGDAAPTVSEEWMKDHTPMGLDGYSYIPGAEDPKVSYTNSKEIYDTLNPSGIVCRRFQDNENTYDATVIAGDNRGSFHDPHVCFRAQGWEFTNERSIDLKTKTRGTITATLATIYRGEETRLALFFYKGPKGYYPLTQNLTTAMIVGPLLGDFRSDSVFYRFMPENSTASEESLVRFAVAYMDEAVQMSDEYF